MASKPSNHYVNNGEFLQALIEYKKSVKQAQENNLPHPPIPEYIGECILKIAEHLSYRPNFREYPFREDMVGDGISNCLEYALDNFDPENYKNPFAYFTQIMWYAFVRRIGREKTQLYVKYKCIQSSQDFSEYVNQAHDDSKYENTYMTYLRQNMSDIITEFEEKKKAKKKKKNKNSLERFFESEEPKVEEVESSELIEIEDEEEVE